MTSVTKKWLSIFSQKWQSQPFFSTNFEECVANFVSGPWLQNATLQKACNVSTLELEQMYQEAYDLYQKNQCNESEELFRLLVMLDPFVEKYWFGLAASLQMQGRYEEALKGYAIMVTLDETSPFPHYYASECLEKLNRNEESQMALNHAIKQAKGKM